MATPLSLRKQIAHLALLAKGDLDDLFRRVSDARSPELREALMDLLPAMVDTYGSAAAAIAADWYDELRDEASARGRFSAIPADLGDTAVQGLIGWAMDTAKSDDAFQMMIDGGMQKRIANASRQTVMRSSVADPDSAGWKRIGVGSCAFCVMLINRDAALLRGDRGLRESRALQLPGVPAHQGRGAGRRQEVRPILPLHPRRRPARQAAGPRQGVDRHPLTSPAARAGGSVTRRSSRDG